MPKANSVKSMKLILRIVLFCFLFFPVPVFSQEGGSSEKKNEVENARMKRKKAKAEWKAKRKEERTDRKAVGSHEKLLQTKETRKRMRKNRRKADRVNQNKREFFLIRMFKPKPRTGKW